MAKTAMIVDDVAYARQVIKEILVKAKYNVVAEASNGDEAINLYEQYKPDFVTMDVVMPVRGGIEAARTIIDRNKSARVLMVSALAHEHLLMEAINAGARDYILKPFSPEDLLRAIEKVLTDEDEDSKGGSHAKSKI